METVSALAMSGAATLVGAMATDAWHQARSAIGRLFGQGDQRAREVAEHRLDRAATEVEAAAPAQRDEVRKRLATAWQTRLADVLEEHPQAAAELRQVIDELRGQLPPAQQIWIQHVVASGQGTVAQGVMFGNIVNHGPHGRSGDDARPA